MTEDMKTAVKVGSIGAALVALPTGIGAFFEGDNVLFLTTGLATIGGMLLAAAILIYLMERQA